MRHRPCDGAGGKPENEPANDAEGPGGVEEAGIIAARILDDCRPKPDVRELLKHVDGHADQRCDAEVIGNEQTCQKQVAAETNHLA